MHSIMDEGLGYHKYIWMALKVSEKLQFTKGPFGHQKTVYLVDPLDGHL